MSKYLQILDFGSNGGHNSGNLVTGNGRVVGSSEATTDLNQIVDFVPMILKNELLILVLSS